MLEVLAAITIIPVAELLLLAVRRVKILNVPPPQSLYWGELMIYSAAGMLVADGAQIGLRWHFYLTDMRLVWEPIVIPFLPSHLQGPQGDVTLSEMRRVHQEMGLKFPELHIQTTEHTLRFILEGAEPDRWVAYIHQHARNLVP